MVFLFLQTFEANLRLLISDQEKNSGREKSQIRAGVGALAGMLAGYLVTEQWLLNFAYHIDLSIGMTVLPVVALVLLAMLVVGYKTYSGAARNPVDILRHE